MDDCQYATIDEIKRFSPALKRKKILHLEAAAAGANTNSLPPPPPAPIQLEYLQEPPPLPPLPPPNQHRRHLSQQKNSPSPPLLQGRAQNSSGSLELRKESSPMLKTRSLESKLEGEGGGGGGDDESPWNGGKPKAASEENVTVSSVELSSKGLHPSLSSPHLSAIAAPLVENGAESLPPIPPAGGTDQADGRGKPPVYATVNKQLERSPPPLPPPLPPEDVPQEGESGLILVPQSWGDGEGKQRKPALLPRAHVYEVVPTDILVQPQAQQEAQPQGAEQYSSLTLFKSSLRRSKKKKSAGSKDKPRVVTKSGSDEERTTPTPLTDLESLPTDGKAVKLAEFVHHFGHYLPLRVRVEEGYCGTEERFVISSGDVYNFHFVKTEKMASIRDCGGSTFSIPLNSAIQFGLLYNPKGQFKLALQGYVFKTVADLAASKHALPRIVCATRAHLTSESKTSVFADEILIVKKIGRTTVMRKPFLKAFSLKTNEDKTLQEDCEGHFSTSPDLVKLYLPEVLEHFSQCLPLESMLYIRQETSDDLPLHLTTDMVTLTHTAIESSIIASTCWDEYQKQDVEISDEDRALVAIPTDLDIEVTFMSRESEDEKLYESTRSYFEKFSTLKIKDMKNSGLQRGKGATLAQTKLYKNIREGYESKGMEIKMPSRISGTFDSELSPKSMVGKPLLEHPNKGGVATNVASSSHNAKKTQSKTEKKRDDLASPHHAPYPVPHPTPHPALHHAPHHAPRYTLNTTGPAAEVAPSTQPKPQVPSGFSKTKESDFENLEKLYSAIDDIFSATIKNAEPAVSPVDPKTLAKPTKEQQVENPTYVPTTRASVAEPPYHYYNHTPKPLPRAKSQTELDRVEKVQQQQRQQEQEVKGQEGVGGDRILAFEELSKNYARLQLEVQQLKKELQNTRELQAGYEVVPTHFEQPHVPAPLPLAMKLRGGVSFPLPAHHVQRPVSVIKATSTEEQEKNKENLRNLDHLQVIALLECMNLGKYKARFMEEQVDGEILAECDEVMLESELKVTSTLHRSRLLKIITGKHSALSYLKQEGDVYSTLDHNL